MSDRKHVLIVEDEEALAEVIRDYLAQSDIDATILTHGHEAVATILDQKPDLVVLDVMLPGKDGISICREVRAQSDVPIIMESAKVEEIDRLLGLELGADDYICKPFSPRELVARVKAVLRRTGKSSDVVTSTRLTLDADKWLVLVDGQPVDLTRREFQLLAALHRRPGQVFSRSQLLDIAFSDETDVFDRTVDSHIKNLRQKIKSTATDFDPIRSVYGVGYAFDA